ncbi:hypothetical protein DL96DRAFT_1590477 [Flagelloscypha sp. PMI_526]|nr:hypothetical protein DL96DRAFT_1590477 [Flagelloscypha sp. PMI_526]
MVHLLSHSHTIPIHFRRLVYASIFLIYPTIAFSLVHFGFNTIFITPLAFLLTVVYHIVLIVKHERQASRKTKHQDLVWGSTGALVCGYMICTVWTAGLGMTVFRIALTIHGAIQFDYFPYFSPFTILEAIFTLATTCVMWALVALATHIRRNGKPKGSYKDIESA